MNKKLALLLIPLLAICACNNNSPEEEKEEITYVYDFSYNQINDFYKENYSKNAAKQHYTIFETTVYVLNVFAKDDGYYLRLVDTETKTNPFYYDPLVLIHGEFFSNNDNDRVCIQSDKDFKTLWDEKPDYLIDTEIKVHFCDVYYASITDDDTTIYQKDDNNHAKHVIACEITK